MQRNVILVDLVKSGVDTAETRRSKFTKIGTMCSDRSMDRLRKNIVLKLYDAGNVWLEGGRCDQMRFFWIYRN